MARGFARCIIPARRSQEHNDTGGFHFRRSGRNTSERARSTFGTSLVMSERDDERANWGAGFNRGSNSRQISAVSSRAGTCCARIVPGRDATRS